MSRKSAQVLEKKRKTDEKKETKVEKEVVFAKKGRLSYLDIWELI